MPTASPGLSAVRAANAIAPDPKYVYASTRLTAAAPSAQDRVTAGNDLRTTVHEYAARYVALPQTPVHVKLAGPATQRIIPTDAHSGRMTWWSDRVDGLDSTLTRTVDLSNAPKATLSFWSWFDLEPDFDYAYVAVSADGQKWTTLKTEATTTDDPNGTNLGNGMSGKSGGRTNSTTMPRRTPAGRPMASSGHPTSCSSDTSCRSSGSARPRPSSGTSSTVARSSWTSMAPGIERHRSWP